MIVLDTSAAVDWLLQTPAGQRIKQRIDPRQKRCTVFTCSIWNCGGFKRLVREGTLSPKRAEEAIEDMALRMTRYALVLLVQRVWRLRQSRNAYDAAHVALAEKFNGSLCVQSVA